MFVDVAAVGSGVGDDDLAAEVLEELRGDGGGGAVGAVDYDAVAVEREAGDGGEEELDVLGAVGFVDRGAWGTGSAMPGARELGQLRKISSSMASSVASGSLKPSGPKSLMPLSCQGLWEAEMTTPAAKPWAAGEEGDGGGGDDAGGFDGGADSGGGDSGGEGGGDPGAGLAGVGTQKDSWVSGSAGEGVGEGQADGVDGGGIERRLACDGADAVGSKELLHAVRVSLVIIRVLGGRGEVCG